jgi:hypothetical protein
MCINCMDTVDHTLKKAVVVTSHSGSNITRRRDTNARIEHAIVSKEVYATQFGHSVKR